MDREGSGYWDSGFFQPVDFFGDGPRIPLIAVSKYSRGGKVAHSYTDHASLGEIHRAQLAFETANQSQP
jgi:phospholipase C